MTDSATINVSSKPREGRPPQEASISEEEWTETRTRTDLYIVVGGDAANVVAVVVALLRFADTTANAGGAVLASLLSAAFAAIVTMTTAYLNTGELKHSSEMHQASFSHSGGPARSFWWIM
jgi:hypothetical protein